MPRDSAGNYQLPAGNPVASGTIISTTWANPTMSDIGTELTNSLDRNGRGGMLAPFKFADGTVVAPAISFTSEPASGIYRAGTNDIRFGITGRDTTRWVNASAAPAGSQVPFEIWDGVAWRPAMYQGGALTGVLVNDVFLKADNQAGDGTVNIVKVNTSDEIEFGAANVVMPNSLLGVGTATANTRVHIYDGASGVIQSGTKGLSIESDTSANIWFLTSNIQQAKLIFGDPENTSVGQIFYDHSVNSLTMLVANTTSFVIDSSSNVTIPNGNLRVGDGAQSPHGNANDLIVSMAGVHTGISILADDAFVSVIHFGTNTLPRDGRITYDNTARSMNMHTAGLQAIILDANQNVTIPNGDLTVHTSTTGLAVGLQNFGTAGFGTLVSTGHTGTNYAFAVKANVLSGTNGTDVLLALGNGNVEIPNGNLTVSAGIIKATSGSSGATANSNADNLVLEGSAKVGMSILSTAAESGSIFFGDPGNAVVGQLTYDHATDILSLVSGGNFAIQMDINQNVTIPGGNLTVSVGRVEFSDVGVSTIASSGDGMIGGIGNNGTEIIGRGSSFDISIYQRDKTAALRIDSSANVTIPNGSLTVSAGPIEVGAYSGAGASAGILMQIDGNTLSSVTVTANTNHYTFVNTNGIVGSISTLNNATGFNTSSDPRLKSKFREIKPETAYALIEQAHDEQMIGEFDWLAGGASTWGYNAHKLIDGGSQLGGSEGQGPRDKPIDGINVTPAGVDQSKRVPLLEAALYGALQRLKELELQPQ